MVRLALTKAARLFSRARIAEKERIVRAALTLATRPAVWATAIDVLSGLGVALPRAGLERAIAAMLSAKAKLPAGFERMLGLWSRGEGEDEGVLFALLARAVQQEKPSSERAQRAGAWLRANATPAQRAALRAIADELAKRPAQQAHVRWSAEAASAVSPRRGGRAGQ